MTKTLQSTISNYILILRITKCMAFVQFASYSCHTVSWVVFVAAYYTRPITERSHVLSVKLDFFYFFHSNVSYFFYQVQHMRRNLDQSEAAIIQVFEEKQRVWERQMDELRQNYASRLQQVTSLHIFESNKTTSRLNVFFLTAF